MRYSFPRRAPTKLLKVADAAVFLAMPTHRDLSPYTVRSLLETQALLAENGIPAEVEISAGNSLPHHARSKVAWHFLQSKCNRLFWVDSDIVWEAEDFLRLTALSMKMACVSGAYPARMDPPTFFMNGTELANGVTANEYGCLPIGGLGLGFTVVQRTVMEALAEKAPKLIYHDIAEPIPSIFRCDDSDGAARGEDMAFFADVKALGHQVFLDPSITLGHVGSKTYTASILDHLTREHEEDKRNAA